MAGDRDVRIKAGFALAKALGTPETRAMFADHGYQDEQPIVMALESDTIQDVFARLQRYAPPVLVAIYWPETERLAYTQMEPSAEPQDYSPERHDVGGGSTIGMLWEHTDRQANANIRFRLQWGQPTMNLTYFQTASV
ncbi:hypothetical protein [Streptacidiphilus cavernicola]|uniref:Uncharacterized protein n=1 Tax=Streptacidiphilus cavernicola TaxID=3342716 RepID=A0ABV6VXX9_9ACTN